MTLSDFRTGHPPVENVGGATSTSAGYPPITQTTFLTCRAHYPGGPNRCVSVFFPVRAAFPSYLVGRHPRLHFRGLLKLHSRYGLQSCSPTMCGLCHEASSQPVSQLQCSLATRPNQHVPGRVLPPLVIWAVGAHYETGCRH